MRSILVVDDDTQLRRSFKKVLAGEGYEVRAVSTGQAALEAVRAAPPDLVIMDLCMPGMGGLETFRAMREIDSRLQVILMTAYGTAEVEREARGLGAAAFALKPFEIREMLAVIRRALGEAPASGDGRAF
jgi:DNA-binding NtrC family response regulator